MNKDAAGKVIDSDYYEKDGRPVYSVTNINKYGIFTSTASPCDEDRENTSALLGYMLAERKNYIKMIHRKAMNFKERAIGIETALNALKNKYDTQKCPLLNGDAFISDLWHQYDVAWGLYNKYQDQYEYMRDDYHNFADRMIKKYNKKSARELLEKIKAREAAIKESNEQEQIM